MNKILSAFYFIFVPIFMFIAPIAAFTFGNFGQPVSSSTLIRAILIYEGIGIAFAFIGFGVLKAKRWGYYAAIAVNLLYVVIFLSWGVDLLIVPFLLIFLIPIPFLLRLLRKSKEAQSQTGTPSINSRT